MNAVIAAGVPIGDPKIEDLLDVFARWLKSGINCIKIGTIQSIDYTKMTASIQIVFQQALRDGTYQTIPALVDCPVFTPQGGGFSLQFPIEKGDTAIVLFADRNIDNWFTSGGVQVPADGRLHSLSDAIAIVGLNSLANPLSTALGHTEAGIGLAGELCKIAIDKRVGMVTIKSNTMSLVTLLRDLIAALQSLTTGLNGLTCAAPGNPITGAAALVTAITTQISSVTTELNMLLY